jgi:hypothetical protein
VGGQRHASAALPPGKTRYPFHRRLGGPQGRSGRVRKISPPPGFDHPTVQPVKIRYTDCAIPAPRKGITAENLTVISDYLDASSRDISSKLGKLDDRLHILEQTVAAAARICLRQTSKTTILNLVH